MPASDHMWSDHEVARYLNVSVWTVKSWRQQGKIGYVELGGVIRYVPEEIKAFAIRNRKAPRCPECGNNAGVVGAVLLPGEVSKTEANYFSDHEAKIHG